MDRAYISLPTGAVANLSNAELFGRLASRLPFALEPTQRAAWEYQIDHLRQLAPGLPDTHALMEFLIPRMGRRADLILLHGGIVFVIEYKLGARQYDRSSLDQVYGYGLDLKHFHETSHGLPIVPILVATHAAHDDGRNLQWDADGLPVGLRLFQATLLKCPGHAAKLYSPTAELAGERRVSPNRVAVIQLSARQIDVTGRASGNSPAIGIRIDLSALNRCCLHELHEMFCARIRITRCAVTSWPAMAWQFWCVDAC